MNLRSPEKHENGGNALHRVVLSSVTPAKAGMTELDEGFVPLIVR